MLSPHDVKGPQFDAACRSDNDGRAHCLAHDGDFGVGTLFHLHSLATTVVLCVMFRAAAAAAGCAEVFMVDRLSR